LHGIYPPVFASHVLLLIKAYFGGLFNFLARASGLKIVTAEITKNAEKTKLFFGFTGNGHRIFFALPSLRALR